MQICHLDNLPVAPSENAVFSRLGRNRALNRLPDAQRRRLGQYLADGIARCRPTGCWRRLNIVDKNAAAVTLDNGDAFASASLAKLLGSSHAALLMAATAGGDIVQAAASAADDGDAVRALVYDAVGSEMADEAIGWIQQYVDRQLRRGGEQLTRRFSPGYGDLKLECQRLLFAALDLQALGLALNSSLVLVPEKSVTALAGIESRQ